MPPSSIPQRAGDWTPKQRLEALMQSAGLEGERLNAFCREQAFINSNSSPSPTTDKSLRIELNQVKKELNRKEKAQAEAAALLVLQKKCQAFWEEKE